MMNPEIVQLVLDYFIAVGHHLAVGGTENY